MLVRYSMGIMSRAVPELAAMSDVDALAAAADAALAVRQQRRTRDEAWRRLHDAGWSARRISAETIAALQGRGLSDVEVGKLGVSEHNVRRVVGL